MIPTLPRSGIMLRCFTALRTVPFSFDKSWILARTSRGFMVYYILIGPLLTALHAVVSVSFVLKATIEMSASCSWGDSRALMGLALGCLMTIGNVVFLTFALNMVLNNDDLLKYYHEMIRFRVKIKGKLLQTGCQANKCHICYN